MSISDKVAHIPDYYKAYTNQTDHPIHEDANEGDSGLDVFDITALFPSHQSTEGQKLEKPPVDEIKIAEPKNEISQPPSHYNLRKRPYDAIAKNRRIVSGTDKDVGIDP